MNHAILTCPHSDEAEEVPDAEVGDRSAPHIGVDHLGKRGGIHGAGVAQAAAAAGHRVLLVEKSALGAGTSSRSPASTR